MEKEINHCGQCIEVPCDRLKAAFSTPGHEDNGERLTNLKSWAKGKEEYLRIRDKKADEEQ